MYNDVASIPIGQSSWFVRSTDSFGNDRSEFNPVQNWTNRLKLCGAVWKVNRDEVRRSSPLTQSYLGDDQEDGPKGPTPFLLKKSRTEDMRRVLKYLGGHEYPIELFMSSAPRQSVPRTVKVVDETSLWKSLNLSNNKLVEGIEDWNDSSSKLSRFPRLQLLTCVRMASDEMPVMRSIPAHEYDHDRLDDGCVAVLTSSLLANSKLEILELRNNHITSHGKELLFQLLGGRDTPTSTYNSNQTLTRCESDLTQVRIENLLQINCSCDSRVNMARRKIYVHYQRAKRFDVGRFLGLEVGVMPHLLDWFGVTKDRGSEALDSRSRLYRSGFSMFYQTDKELERRDAALSSLARQSENSRAGGAGCK
ncbi:hypothetical protein THAOC_02917 [Thalassiosira oceanica]|uniref:Uncharacterized protein n=1 Tax=Thalassiosira oceanica TaxID=159749 RepID=K0TLJ5_THAOC|nr:hypothetical protein THAOC_02917 [Thalassiosira oceanica]|eukprot:EJK75361.1 hypothetical protein THAOC_02917 [Thalassiosira oceanica]